MPLFISDAEFEGLRDNPDALASRADEAIAGLQYEAEKLRAQAESEAIIREQTCSQLEQRYLALAEEYRQLEVEQRRLQAGLADASAELAQARTQAHQEQLNKVRSIFFMMCLRYQHNSSASRNSSIQA
jgi:nucleoprotein TPR